MGKTGRIQFNASATSLLCGAVLFGLSACNGSDSASTSPSVDSLTVADTQNAPSPAPVAVDSAAPTPGTPATPAPAPTGTATPSPSPAPSTRPTSTPSPTPRPPATATPTPTPKPTASPTPAPTSSPTPTGSALYTGPAEVEKFVVKFVDDAKAQGVDVLPDMKNPKLSIQIAKLDQYGSSVIGLCESGGGKRLVTFDPDFWNSVSDTQKELLAHHELGHCVLYRPHRSDMLSTGKYASIMYPTIMSSSTYTSNYAYYQNELFTYKTAGMEDPTVPKPDTIVHICDQKDLGL